MRNRMVRRWRLAAMQVKRKHGALVSSSIMWRDLPSYVRCVKLGVGVG